MSHCAVGMRYCQQKIDVRTESVQEKDFLTDILRERVTNATNH